jgi:inositol phosphorylceramide mannosyltransferase catalytic subunit
MLSLYPGRNALRILWGPNNLHQLSGAVTTPLFRHLGLSSWHSVDGAIVHFFKFGPAGHILVVTLRLTLVGIVVLGAAILWHRLPARMRRRRIMLDKKKVDDEQLVLV